MKLTPFQLTALIAVFCMSCTQVPRSGIDENIREYVEEYKACECDLVQDYSLDEFILMEEDFGLNEISNFIKHKNDSVLGTGFISNWKHDDFIDLIDEHFFKWRDNIESGDFVLDEQRTSTKNLPVITGSKTLFPMQLNADYVLNPKMPKNEPLKEFNTDEYSIKQYFYSCYYEVSHAGFGREAAHKGDRYFYWGYQIKLGLYYQLRIENVATGQLEQYDFELIKQPLHAFTKSPGAEKYFKEIQTENPVKIHNEMPEL
ncbi:MAG: hypothetical protein ACPGLV_09975, partial [Bacteroidia bacterium]